MVLTHSFLALVPILQTCHRGFDRRGGWEARFDARSGLIQIQNNPTDSINSGEFYWSSDGTECFYWGQIDWWRGRNSGIPSTRKTGWNAKTSWGSNFVRLLLGEGLVPPLYFVLVRLTFSVLLGHNTGKPSTNLDDLSGNPL